MNTLQGLLNVALNQENHDIAIEYGSKKLKYCEVDLLSKKIAYQLLEMGLPKGSHIGIYMDNLINIPIVMLGIVRAGMVFVPMSSNYPDKHIELQIEVSDIVVLFTESTLYQSLKIDGIKIIDEKILQEWYDKELIEFEEPEYSLNDKLYIFFTSGSTGVPKAILGTNKGVVNCIEWEREEFQLGSGTRFSQLTVCSHDPYLRDVFLPFAINGVVCIPKAPTVRIKSSELIEWVDKDDIHVIHCTPSVFRKMNAVGLQESIFKNLKCVFLAGERIVPKELIHWYDIFGERIRIVNLYGPSETTMIKMFHEITKEDCAKENIPIGQPIKACRIIILDDNMNVCQTNEIGEIYIRTPYMTLGYYKNEKLTKERFIQNPFSQQEGDLLYKTGDLARKLPSGKIELIGRKDRQIKIRGNRVELSEIENRIVGTQSVQACVTKLIVKDKNVIQGNKIKTCTRCGIKSTYPKVTIENGVCNKCRLFDRKKDIIKSYFSSPEVLFDKLTANKSEDGYDCILLYSGGKDSTYVLYQLVQMNLKVLAYTFDNGYISEEALNNIKNTTSKLGVDNVIETYDKMDQIFKSGILRERAVCNSCFKVLRILSTRLAYKKGIKYIITGFSRGQIMDLRLEDILEEEKEYIIEMIKNQRLVYHSKNDHVLECFPENERVTREMIEKVELIDFYRYSQVTQEEIMEYIKKQDIKWTMPKDTGFCSSNCKINDVGIYLLRNEFGYDNYTAPNSWEVRLNHIDLVEAKKQGEGKLDYDNIHKILKHLNIEEFYQPYYEQDERIVAYYVADNDIDENQMTDYLISIFPSYMVPYKFIKIDEIPMTVNGKIDYIALPDDKVETKKEYLAPRNSIEERLVDIYSEILNCEEVSVNDHFLIKGGHSMNVMTLIAKIYQEFEVEVPIGAVFENDTIEGLAEYIEEYLEEYLEDEEEIEDSLNRAKACVCEQKDTKIIHKQKYILENIKPFNDIFFKSCYFNSFFASIHGSENDIYPFLQNDIAVYDIKNNKVEVKYIPIHPIDTILEKTGIIIDNTLPKEDVLNDIMESLLQDKAVIVAIDCYYEPLRMEMYQKNNWAHSLLVYGFDLEKRIFHILEHSGVYHLDYKPAQISFDDLLKAHEGFKKNFGNTFLFPSYTRISFQNDESKPAMDRSFNPVISAQKKQEIKEFRENYEAVFKCLKEYVRDENTYIEHIKEIEYLVNEILMSKKAELYKIEKSNDMDCKEIMSIFDKWERISNGMKKHVMRMECNKMGFALDESLQLFRQYLDQLKEEEIKYLNHYINE